MPRDLAAELDELKAMVSKLLPQVEDSSQKVTRFSNTEASSENTKGACLSARALRLEGLAKEHGVSGLIECLGFFGTDGYGYYTDLGLVPVDDLLGLDGERTSKVFAALGSKPRLMLLLEILQRPATAAELMERLDMGTTGQVYHHLKALQSADLIEQVEKNIYRFRAHRVQGFITLLLGAAEVLDTQYTTGNWEDESLQ